jgi:hypothetical protein
MTVTAILGSSLFFWGIFLLWIVILWATVEWERGLLGFLSIVGYLLVLQFVFGVDVLQWVFTHPFYLLGMIALYFPMGAAWSACRWYWYATDQLSPYIDARTKWLISKKETKFDKVPEHLREEWVKYVEGHNYTEDRRPLSSACKPPLVRDHKGRIMRWIGYWPISLLSWTCNDMVRRFVRMIYDSIANWLQGIANKVFAQIRGDLPEDFKV